MSVQFQPVMQSQMIENAQIIDQSQIQPQIQQQFVSHINQQMQQQQQQPLQPLPQPQQYHHFADPQQKLNGSSYSVQSAPQLVPFPPQVTQMHSSMHETKHQYWSFTHIVNIDAGFGFLDFTDGGTAHGNET